MVLGNLPVPTIWITVGQGPVALAVGATSPRFLVIHSEEERSISSLSPFVIKKILIGMLGKLPVPGRPTILITVGQGPIALAVGAGEGGLDIFTLIYFFSLSPSLWETARYRLKYCLKGPLNPNNQPTNQLDWHGW